MISAKETKQLSLLEGPITSSMVRFFIPVALGFIFQQFYTMTDAIILGRFIGKNALAAVGGSASSIINVITLFFAGFTSGGCIVIAQAFGSGDRQRSKRGTETALCFSAILGAVLTIAGIIFAPALLRMLDTPEDIIGLAISYMRWYVIGMIPTLVYNMGNAVLRSMGDSRKPLSFLIIGTCVNVVLDLIFVAVLKLGVQGAAAASVISQLLSAILTFRCLSKAENGLSLKMDGRILKSFLKMGLPTGFQNALYTLTSLFVQRAINILGTDSIAGWSAFFRLDGYFWSISAGFNITMLTFSGQNFGAHNIGRIRKGVKSCLLLDLASSVAFAAVMCLTRTWGIALFSSDPAVIAIGSEVIMWTAPFYPLFAFTEIFSAAIRGTGDTAKPSVITFFTVCVLRIGLLYLFALNNPTNIKIALCYPISWAVSSVIFTVFFLCCKALKPKESI